MSIEAQRGAERGLIVAKGHRGLGAVSIEAQRGAERGLILAARTKRTGTAILMSIEAQRGAERGLLLAIMNSGLEGRST